MDERWDPDEIERDWLDALALVELRRIASEVSGAAAGEAGHFEGIIEDRRGESWSWRQDLAWTDENREKLRDSRNVPGEDRTRTVRADPQKLREGVSRVE